MAIRAAAGFLHNEKKISKNPVNYQLAYTSNMQREIKVGLKRIEPFYWTTKITRKGCLSDTCKHDELMAPLCSLLKQLILFLQRLCKTKQSVQ